MITREARLQHGTCADHVKALHDLHLPPIFKKHVQELRRTWVPAEMRVALRSFQDPKDVRRVQLLEAAIAASGTVPEGSAADLAARLLKKAQEKL